jgi:hypothetical protein
MFGEQHEEFRISINKLGINNNKNALYGEALRNYCLNL